MNIRPIAGATFQKPVRATAPRFQSTPRISPAALESAHRLGEVFRALDAGDWVALDAAAKAYIGNPAETYPVLLQAKWMSLHTLIFTDVIPAIQDGTFQSDTIFDGTQGFKAQLEKSPEVAWPFLHRWAQDCFTAVTPDLKSAQLQEDKAALAFLKQKSQEATAPKA